MAAGSKGREVKAVGSCTCRGAKAAGNRPQAAHAEKLRQQAAEAEKLRQQAVVEAEKQRS